jgi:hypothetical protein
MIKALLILKHLAVMVSLTVHPGGHVTVTDTSPQVGTPASVVVQEDDPGWNCHDMGNRICGGDLQTDPSQQVIFDGLGGYTGIAGRVEGDRPPKVNYDRRMLSCPGMSSSPFPAGQLTAEAVDQKLADGTCTVVSS